MTLSDGPNEVAALHSPTAPDPRAGLVANTWIGQERLVGLAQPTEWNRAGIEAASAALRALTEALARTTYMADLSGAERLTRAFAAANEDVLSTNRSRAGNDRGRHAGVGLAIVLGSPRFLTIGIVPPAQVVLFTGSEQTWLPSQASWTGGNGSIDVRPLGWTDTVKPAFFSVPCGPNDSVLMTTGAVGETLSGREITALTADDLSAHVAKLGNEGDIDPYEMIILSTGLGAGSVGRSIKTGAGNVRKLVSRGARTLANRQRTDD